ncbi:receptor-like protein EIX2 [Coffea eugenioides]|uniref:receptor-like protein EIX2 n=1 Tax=Coffea eugenioides TaxID=49369 RepID=UPI000F6159FD|nr:receptor-like protein EIX2 [Coffea eugenioides]
MGRLESLDLSRNHLSGTIPSSISKLSSLGFLNLSFNNLSGKIPSSTQMLSFDASSFAGNQLCGRPLTVHCGSSSTDGVTVIKEESVETAVDYWLYICIGVGFVIGFWAVSFTLILKKSWRYAYFRFVDEAWYRLQEHFFSIRFMLK